MDSELRVPPSVSMAFERLASEVCERAALDYDDWPLRAHEFSTHLQEKWREGIALDLGTEAAERRAVESFGTVEEVARSLRRPWIVRLLGFRRYQTERVVVFLAASFLIAWLTVLDVHYRKELENAAVDMGELMLPFSLANFVSGLGGFYVGFAAWAAARLIRWQPRFKNPLIGRACELRYLAGVILLLPLFHLAIRPSLLAIDTFKHFEGYFLYVGFCGLHLLSIFAGLLGLACLAAELFIDTTKWKRLSSRLAFQLIK